MINTKVLSKEVFEQSMRKWSQTPSPSKKKKSPEAQIQKAIMEYLRAKKILCWKNTTTGIYKKSTGSYIPNSSAGAPDIISIIDGKFYGIEVKTPKGIQSPLQKAFQKNIEKAGGVYILARSVDDIIKIIK